MRGGQAGAPGATRWLAAFLGTAAILWLTAGVAPAAPPGNNGTVKVNGTDIDSGPGNEPHQGCVFEINFFGYDEGPSLFATYTLEGQAPTGGGVFASGTVFIGEDAAGGGTDLDATATVDLTGALVGVTPTAQGDHIKLTVNADGSKGSDVKHKTFWVLCADDGGGGPT